MRLVNNVRRSLDLKNAPTTIAGRQAAVAAAAVAAASAAAPFIS